MAPVARACDAPLPRSRARAAAVRAGLSRTPRRPSVHVRRSSARAADRRLRPNETEAARRSEKPPLVLALPGSRRGEIGRMAAVFGEALAICAERHRRAGDRRADAAAARGTRERGGRALAGAAARRPRCGGAAQRFSQRPRGAREVRHGDARARTCASADRCRLPRLRARSNACTHDDQRRFRHSRQSRSRRAHRSGAAAGSLHGAEHRARAERRDRRYAGAGAAASRVRAARRRHGNRPRGTECACSESCLLRAVQGFARV